MDKYGVQIEAWAPFGEGRGGLFEDPALLEIGAKYQKTAAQVMLRWHIERGVAVIPKSTHYERMMENFNVFDFTLSAEDMEKIAGLDKKESSFFPIMTRRWSSGSFRLWKNVKRIMTAGKSVKLVKEGNAKNRLLKSINYGRRCRICSWKSIC